MCREAPIHTTDAKKERERKKHYRCTEALGFDDVVRCMQA